MVSWTHPEKAVSRLNSDALVTQLPSSSLDNEKRQALSEYEAACFIKNEIEKYLKENKDLKM